MTLKDALYILEPKTKVAIYVSAHDQTPITAGVVDGLPYLVIDNLELQQIQQIKIIEDVAHIYLIRQSVIDISSNTLDGQGGWLPYVPLTGTIHN